jgi:hypothetical protein
MISTNVNIKRKYTYVREQCCGPRMFFPDRIPDPVFSHPGFQISDPGSKNSIGKLG